MQRTTNLDGVHPHLVNVVRRAQELRPNLEFCITEGVRSEARQRQLVASGASQTMKSRHLTGHAVDIAPVLDGQPVWDWPLVYLVAAAMCAAAIDLNTDVEWGAVWDKSLLELNPADMEGEHADYVARRKAVGRKAFSDGPHFQLSEASYPAGG